MEGVDIVITWSELYFYWCVFLGSVSIESFINFNSSYVLYRLECEYGYFYTGQRKRKLPLRAAEHKYAVRNEKHVVSYGEELWGGSC